MNYNGDYSSSNIYGTSNNHKVTVTTEDDANFLSCELTVDFNGVTWEHTFEVPFFQSKAEFHFENHIHSLMTQSFGVDTLELQQLNLYSFDLAAVKMVLKEMKQTEALETLEHNFKMILGNHETIAYSFLETGNQKMLSLPRPTLLTLKGVVSLSFLAEDYPTHFVVNDGTATVEYPFPTATSDKLLHTATIPISVIQSSNSGVLTVSLKFSAGSIFEIGSVEVIEDSVDHTLVAFQNNHGSVSVAEFTGEIRKDHRFKSKEHKHVSDNTQYLSTSEISISFPFTINTGYILESQKYELISLLLRSYNIFVLDGSLQRLILSGSNRLMPYKSKYYQHNETLKFKKAENDDIHYRII